MNHTEQQLYDVAVAFQAEEAAWGVRYSAKCQGQNILPTEVMRKGDTVETGFEDWEAAQARYVHLRRVAAMKAALAVLEEK